MRASGILLHISSLPSPHGIGTMGAAAKDFVDFLVKAGQAYWQILPVCPTSYGDSPYQSFSTFAGNPYFIDLDLLAKAGLLQPEEYESIDWESTPGCVNYGALYQKRYAVLHKACARLLAAPPADYADFLAKNAFWLPDYALFMALKDAHNGVCWQQWEEPLRRREPETLAAARAQYAAMVREAYRNYKHNNYLTYIFASKDFADVARRIANIRGVAKLREAKLREIAETAQEVGRQQELLAAQQQALDSTRRKIDAQRARYERDQRNAKARLQRMSAREKAVLREKERQEEQLDTAIAELQKLTKGNKAGASFSTRTSNLNLPVEGGRVKRYRDNMAEITGPKGARITAIYEGKVVDVKRNRITNRFDVYIAHGQYITSYANLNSVSVAKGQTVAKNSAIGVIGPAVDIQTMKTEYRLVFGIYPPAGAKKMRASDCFRK